MMFKLLISVVIGAAAVGLYNYQFADSPNILSSKLDFNRSVEDTYDYIIVGGGSAGCVLANRLTEDASRQVLLVEAGGDGLDDSIRQPAQVNSLWHNPHFDWSYSTVKQEFACQNNRIKECDMPSGRTLGGGSAVNCMVYVRGAKQDFDNWASMGAHGWSYSDVLPYFIKMENVVDRILRGSKFRGINGPLAVSQKKRSFIQHTLMEAAQELGYTIGEDYNGESQETFSPCQYNIRGSSRSSTNREYLYPAMTRANLRVITHTHVRKVLFKELTAVGVEYERGGSIHRVHATKEIILSAGTIGSPKILLLSGIGPRKHLEDIGIPVLSELPVGLNYHDHTQTLGPDVYIDQPIDKPRIGLSGILDKIQDYFHGNTLEKGPCSIEIMSFHKTHHPREDIADACDVEVKILTTPYQKQVLDHFKKMKTWDEYHNPGSHGLAFVISPNRPRSRGTLKLRSKDPLEAPIIDYQHLSNSYDRDVMLAGIKIGLSLVNTSVLGRIGAVVKDELLKLPPCQQHDVRSDEYWKCFMRYQTRTMHHYTGTCRMGRLEDSTTVVDSELRVKGFRNLRVVDASVMPMVTSGNINAPTIMIAEKAADIIKGNNIDVNNE